MLRRELFGSAALLAGAAMYRTVSAQSLPANARSQDQSDYLFWLGDAERMHARRAAEALLTELDAATGDRRRLQGMHQRASVSHRKKYTETAFSDRIVKVRTPLGRLKERSFQGVEGGFRFLPNFQDGEYAIVVFDSLFATRNEIHTEQVTVARNGQYGNDWLFVDYYVAIRPYYKY